MKITQNFVFAYIRNIIWVLMLLGAAGLMLGFMTISPKLFLTVITLSIIAVVTYYTED